jgi:hypothetical protein
MSGGLQEQQTRMRLEEELLTCQQAAAELREQIQMFLQDVECPLPSESLSFELMNRFASSSHNENGAWPSPGGEHIAVCP